jgi:hypothetical protein
MGVDPEQFPDLGLTWQRFTEILEGRVEDPGA